MERNKIYYLYKVAEEVLELSKEEVIIIIYDIER